jgi:hypothetical protein
MGDVLHARRFARAKSAYGKIEMDDIEARSEDPAEDKRRGEHP